MQGENSYNAGSWVLVKLTSKGTVERVLRKIVNVDIENLACTSVSPCIVVPFFLAIAEGIGEGYVKGIVIHISLRAENRKKRGRTFGVSLNFI
jgi:hypothetical protein